MRHPGLSGIPSLPAHSHAEHVGLSPCPLGALEPDQGLVHRHWLCIYTQAPTAQKSDQDPERERQQARHAAGLSVMQWACQSCSGPVSHAAGCYLAGGLLC